MKTNIFVATLLIALVSPAFPGVVKGAPLIAIDSFRNDSCRARTWWRVGTGDELTIALLRQLSKLHKFNFYNSDDLGDLILTRDIDIDGHILHRSAKHVMEVTGATYLVMLKVNGFSEIIPRAKDCECDPFSNTEKTMNVEVQLVGGDGMVMQTQTITSASLADEDKADDFSGKLTGSLDDMDSSRIGLAVRASVMKIAEFVECAIVNKNACLENYKSK